MTTSIRWNWKLDKPLAFVDFETASKVNLREVGSLAKLRDALGEAWHAGHLPPHVPYWHMTEVR